MFLNVFLDEKEGAQNMYIEFGLEALFRISLHVNAKTIILTIICENSYRDTLNIIIDCLDKNQTKPKQIQNWI